MDGLIEISSHFIYFYTTFQEPESSLLKDEDWKK